MTSYLTTTHHYEPRMNDRQSNRHRSTATNCAVQKGRLSVAVDAARPPAGSGEPGTDPTTVLQAISG